MTLEFTPSWISCQDWSYKKKFLMGILWLYYAVGEGLLQQIASKHQMSTAYDLLPTGQSFSNILSIKTLNYRDLSL